MSDAVLIALIVNAGAIIVALINRSGWRRCEVKLEALANHLGLKLEDTGKVIVLERKPVRVVPAEQNE